MVPFVLRLHRLLFAHSGPRGGNLESDENLIVSYENGRREVVFTPPPPAETEFLLGELLARYEDAKRHAGTHPLILIGALVLDFLAIHPVADGNGRLARLLTTHELLAQDYGVARYVSIEQRIYESKNSYASLHESQRNWHEAEHDAWPWITYLCRILADAYDGAASRRCGKADGQQAGQGQGARLAPSARAVSPAGCRARSPWRKPRYDQARPRGASRRGDDRAGGLGTRRPLDAAIGSSADRPARRRSVAGTRRERWDRSPQRTPD